MPRPKRHPTHDMYRSIYPLRMLGMGLGGVVTGVVLWERSVSPVDWTVLVLICLVWPQVAFWLARRSADPYRAEIRNLVIDSALTAVLVPLMHFALLPSVLLCTLTMQDKITTGIQGLWARSLPGMMAAGLAGTLLLRPGFEPESSLWVTVACLPVLVMHSLAVSVTSYRLIRKVSHQNQQLDELRRIDALTGLYGRHHWQEQAEAALARFQAEGTVTSLLMLDIDHFKHINDQWGHSVGDEVIRSMAQLVRANVRATDCAGRYGGDEFAVVLPAQDLAAAHAVAERIRAQAFETRLPGLPELRLTCSIGIAATDPAHQRVRDWVDAADAALYQTKHDGRNGISIHPGSERAGAPLPAAAPPTRVA